MLINLCIVWTSTWVPFLRVYALDVSNNTCFVKTSFSEAIRSGRPLVQECYESYFLSHLVSTSLPSTFHLNEWWNGCDNRFSYLLKGCCCARGHDRLRTWFSPTDSGDNLIALDSQPCRSGADNHAVAYFWCIPMDQAAFPKFTQVGRRVVYRKCDGWMDHCDYDSGFLPVAAITLTDGKNLNLLQFLTKNRLGVQVTFLWEQKGKNIRPGCSLPQSDFLNSNVAVWLPVRKCRLWGSQQISYNCPQLWACVHLFVHVKTIEKINI